MTRRAGAPEDDCSGYEPGRTRGFDPSGHSDPAKRARESGQRDRELILGLLIEYHSLVIAFRTAKPSSHEYHQLVRREERIQQRIREITAA